jgi:hypothetical protein
MSFLYRNAITITRTQLYIDWANGIDDGGPALTEELATDRRTIYLAGESARPDLRALLDQHWEDIFEEELAMWMDAEDTWPTPRTRELFDAWFDAELTDTIVDLVPEQPLTQIDVETADLDEALHFCAWCDLEIDEGEGRFVGFELEHREKLAHRFGLTLPLNIGRERMILGIVSPDKSHAAGEVDDLVFRVCTRRCEKAIRKVVPKALKKLSAV